MSTGHDGPDHGAGQPVVDLERLRRACGDCSLRTLCLPEGLSSADVDRIESIVEQRQPLDRAEMLFRAGDEFHHLYVVRSGAMRTTLLATAGEEQVIGFHLPGELLGLDAISAGRHRCTATALEHTNVCAVPFDRLEAVAEVVPSLQRQLLRIVSREMVEDHKHMATLGRRSARERLALFLYSLSARLERSGQGGEQISMSMSRADIASYLGLALETVSRLLGRLADEGVIAIDRRHLRIVDRERLAEAAGGAGDAEVAGARSGQAG